MIEIKNLKKIWEDDGTSVLEDINLTIEDGDIYALVGRSGAGGRSFRDNRRNGRGQIDASSVH